MKGDVRQAGKRGFRTFLMVISSEQIDTKYSIGVFAPK